MVDKKAGLSIVMVHFFQDQLFIKTGIVRKMVKIIFEALVDSRAVL